MDTPAFAKYHTVLYDLNPESGWYARRNDLVPFTRMPVHVKVEQTQEQRIRDQGADHVLVSPKRAKKYTFFTGLRPLPIPDWYVGNDYESVKGKSVRSLILFEFTPDKALLTVYYFSRYYKDDREERTRYSVAFIRYLQRQRAA